MMKKAVFISFALICAVAPAFAGWTVTVMSGSPWASGMYLGATFGANVAFSPNGGTPCSWTSSSAAPVVNGNALQWPSGAASCTATGVYDQKIVGSAKISSRDHACFWDATTGNYTNLNAIGPAVSYAYCAQYLEQVGSYALSSSGARHACIWYGAPSSKVDLNPGPQYVSAATGLYNGWVTGYTIDNYGSGTQHAALWNNSATSWIDLGPGCGDAIYGTTLLGGNNNSACLWTNATSGTSSDTISYFPQGNVVVPPENLPPGERWEYWLEEDPVAIQGNYCVGSNYESLSLADYYGVIGWRPYISAYLWVVTSGSFVDLNSFLSYTSLNQYDSYANAIYAASDGEIWVSGATSNQPVLWHYMPGISGNITLQNYQADVTQVPVTVEIQSTSSTTAIETDTVSLDSAGNYSFIPTTQGLSGAYNVVVKASHWLAQCVPTVLDTDGSGVASFSLINGDVNGDNFIEDQDYSLLGVSWYSSVGDANYNVNADLNGDGFVEDQDYSIMGMNWYASGDPF